MLKTKSRLDPAEPDFVAAQGRWNEIRATDRELMARHEAMRLALLFTANQDISRVSKDQLDKAQPYMNLANRRPEKLQDDLGDVADEIAVFKPKLGVEHELWQAARRRETNRLAGELQPRHQAAVKGIAKALETLSLAIEQETTTRKELARVAPERESALLPNCSDDLVVGTLADFNSPASAWAKRMRRLKILG